MAGKKILIADDEARLRKLVSDYLVREGYEVLEAADGEQALDIFYREKDLSLMILDVMMPGVDGFMVCKEVRETSQIPIVMLTAKSEENDILNGYEYGADEYIPKPFVIFDVEALYQSKDLGGTCQCHYPQDIGCR